MVFASIFTYLIFHFFDKTNLFPSSHYRENILTSLTFINPFVLGKIFDTTHFDYINGSYWSLWPEVQFYLFASLLFYFNKKKFAKYFILVSFALIISNYILQNIQGSNVLKISLTPQVFKAYATWIQQTFNFIIYLPFFTLGVIFYLLFKNKLNNVKTGLIIKFCLAGLILVIVYSGIQLPVRFLYVAMILLFFGFIYFPNKLGLLEHKSITSIGKSSYFLYLIHENLGVLFIYSFGSHFLPVSFIFTILVMLFLIQISRLFTIHVDQHLHVALATNKYIGTRK